MAGGSVVKLICVDSSQYIEALSVRLMIWTRPKWEYDSLLSHGASVVGYSMEKDGKVKVYKNPPGKASMCVEVHYPAFGT